jgi:S-adenosylmethionine synthetase
MLAKGYVRPPSAKSSLYPAPIYSETTNDGHFGMIDDLATFTWERTDKAAALKKAVGK